MDLQSKGHEAAMGLHVVWGERGNMFLKTSTNNPEILLPAYLLQVLMLAI